jgi:hypothetical protein
MYGDVQEYSLETVRVERLMQHAAAKIHHYCCCTLPAGDGKSPAFLFFPFLICAGLIFS